MTAPSSENNNGTGWGPIMASYAGVGTGILVYMYGQGIESPTVTTVGFVMTAGTVLGSWIASGKRPDSGSFRDAVSANDTDYLSDDEPPSKMDPIYDAVASIANKAEKNAYILANKTEKKARQMKKPLSVAMNEFWEGAANVANKVEKGTKNLLGISKKQKEAVNQFRHPEWHQSVEIHDVSGVGVNRRRSPGDC
ncbi:MAG TPA: hypothetical protein VGF14_00955 [Alphaproteobacteria bacterium]